MRHQLRKLLTAVAMTTILLGCGNKDNEMSAPASAPVEGEITRPMEQRNRAVAVSEQFEFLRFVTNEDSVTPELCLTFSKSLDPDTDYSAYLDIDASVAIEIDGQRMCLGGLAYGDTKDVTLREGLPSAVGDKLERAETVTLTFDDRPAMVAFAGDGIILPRIDADGLAINTVNVDSVDVRITRVNDRALVMRSVGAGFRAAENEYYYDYGEDTPGRFGELIWEGEMSTAGPTNATVTTVLPIASVIGQIEPGAYYVAVSDKKPAAQRYNRPARAARWIIMTDLALTAYRGETGLDFTVRSLQTAAPQPGIQVQLVAQSNEVLGTVTTDGQGQARFDGPLMNGEAGNTPRLIMAFGENGDFAMLDFYRAPVDLSVHPVTGRVRDGDVDGYLYLDRGIYRPGEIVQASALIRDAAGRAVVNRAGSLVLYKPNGIEQGRVRFGQLEDAGGLTKSFTLPDSAVRGRWRIDVDIDGAGTVQTVSFAVEDFVPQRVELTLDADIETPITNQDPRMVRARAYFLYGAPGAGLTIDGTARIQRDLSPFKQWIGYQFGHHNEQLSEMLITLPSVVADGAGEAVIPISPGRNGINSTFPLRIRAVIEVEEPGGRSVADDVRIPYRPRSAYYGLKPGHEGRADQNKAVNFAAIAVDSAGTLLSQEVTWRLVRRDYDYDWYRVDGGRWKWRRSERVVEIETGVLRLDGDTAGEINTRALDWGDYRMVLTVDGEDVASSAFWVGWGGYSEDGVEAPDQVRVSGSSETVTVGKLARVSIQAPYPGLAEVVVAGDRIISTQHVQVGEGGTEVDLPVTAEWGAGAYVMVTVYTPRDSATQPRPRRALGVTHLPVDVDPRTFEVTVDLPEKVEPNQTINVPIRVTDGPANQKIFATIAAVDEGILLLTKHQSPNPVDWFFGKTALGVQLYDDYGRLLDPNQGAAAPVRSGGDQIGGAGLTVVPTKTVALFQGPVELGRGGRGRVPLELPDFNGKLRLMVVAWSETAIGAGEHALIVRDTVPAEMVLPRFLAPGDSAYATLSLDNVEGAAGEYDIAMASDGPIAMTEGATTMALAEGQRQDQLVGITAAGEGIAYLSLSVSGPARFEAESNYPIEVRSAYWPESKVTKLQLAPGASYSPDPEALASFTEGSGYLQISAAATPIDTSALYRSLYRYPYACTEQLTSRMLPLLYSGQLARLAGGGSPEGAAGDIRGAIETLLSRQSAGGSFGLWRVGDGGASPWIGAYATDFITRAAAADYAVPKAALARALAALEPVAAGQIGRSGYNGSTPNSRWSDDTNDRLVHRSSAYALYVLARNGRGDRSRLRYMHDELRGKIESPLALAHIGAGLSAMGDRGRAHSAFDAAVSKLGYDNNGDWYQTARRDLAGVLALAAEAGMTDIVTVLAERVVEDVPAPNSLSTQEKAFLILASQALVGDAEKIGISYSADVADPATVGFTDVTLGNAGTFTNVGDSPLWLTALATGSPASAPAASGAQLQVNKTVTDLSGQLVDFSKLAQGDRLVVVITVRPRRAALAPYMVADLLPAGFEIDALVKTEDGAPSGVYSFIGKLSDAKIAEARDDRFVAAFDGHSGKTYRFAYLVRAVTPGTFTMPGVVAEDMYKSDVFARSVSGKVFIAP